MTKQTTVAAAAIEAMNFEDKNAAYEQGGRYAENKLERLRIAEDAARTLGTSPSLDRWDAYRIQWVDGLTHRYVYADSIPLLDDLYASWEP